MIGRVFSTGRIQLDVPLAVRVPDGSDSPRRSCASSWRPGRTLSEVCLPRRHVSRLHPLSDPLVLVSPVRWSPSTASERLISSSGPASDTQVLVVEPPSETNLLHYPRSTFLSLLLLPAEPIFQISTKPIKSAAEEEMSENETEEWVWPEPQERVVPPVRTAVVLPDDVTCPDGCQAFSSEGPDLQVVCRLRYEL